jgi:ubiquinone/menaquinone biosynthesis C-methylase UbiE
MTTTTTADLEAIKQTQQKTWASGDFSVVATRIQFVAEQLAEAAELRAGWRVLDVATGSGNAAVAAARSGTSVVGVDYVPQLLADGRTRAHAEGLDIEFREGDAEDLPVATGEFDAVLSVFGSMFAPDHVRAAQEIARATRPGGTIALASWTPTGFIGDMFRVVAQYAPPPAGVTSPMRWGDETHLRLIFGTTITEVHSHVRTCVFRFTTPEEFVAFFRKYYGPTNRAFARLDEATRTALATDLAALAREADTIRDGGSIAIPATYLETIARRT